MIVMAFLLACAQSPTVTPVPVAPAPVALAAAATVFANEKGEPLCPVMGEVTPEETAVSSTVYDGTTYYFCCETCAEKFAADPAKYADGAFLHAEGLGGDQRRLSGAAA